MAACHWSCTNSMCICATGFLFVAGTWREHGGNMNAIPRDHAGTTKNVYLSFVMMFIFFEPKCFNCFAPVGDPKAKMT